MNRKIITFNKHLMAPRNPMTDARLEPKPHKQMKRSSSNYKNISIKSTSKAKSIRQKPAKNHLSPPPREIKDLNGSRNKKLMGSRGGGELSDRQGKNIYTGVKKEENFL
jgi:hypothetical protein